MEGPKITLTITKSNGEQTVINADHMIGCVHEEGAPNGDMKVLGIGVASAARIASAKVHIDDLFRRMAEKDPLILFALMTHNSKNDIVSVSEFEIGRIPKKEDPDPCQQTS